MESTVREFFRQRIGSNVIVPAHLCPKHKIYKIHVKKVGPRLLCVDAFRYLGASTGEADRTMEVVLTFDKYSNPSAVFTDIVRIVDGEKALGEKTARKVLADAKLEKIKAALSRLIRGEGLSKEEIPPTEAACLRLIEMAQEEPRLIVPDIFSSKDGTIRARWRHGKTTVWAKITGNKKLSWVLWAPKNGGGTHCLYASTDSLAEFIFFVSALGVPVINQEF